MSFKYQLDQSAKKFICPSCQKKRFVRYLNSETNNYCDDVLGRCDREVSCGYHKLPDGKADYKIVVPKPAKPPHFISTRDFAQTLSHYQKNNLYSFICQLFGVKKTKQVFHLYRVGTSKKWGGATLFWQINSKGQIGQGKIMVFNQSNGKRVKHPKPLISSVHAQLNKQDQKPEYCYFGEHLINQYTKKPIAIVESEKTALIMTIIQAECLWIASGSLSNLSNKRMQHYLNRTIILYPDLGAYDKWQEKAIKLNKLGHTIKVSTLLEDKASEQDKNEGFDIADYFVQERFNDLLPEKEMKEMIIKNPVLQTLVDKFHLVPIK